MSTGTLDLSRIHAERRRQEAERDGPVSEPTVERDAGSAADHARRIVEEVLSAADTKDEDGSGDDDVTTVFDPNDATSIAHRIVEQVLEEERARTRADTAATITEDEAIADPTIETQTAQPWPGGDVASLEKAADATARADLVLLGLDRPLVLLPGPAYEPTEEPWVPQNGHAGLAELTDKAFGPLVPDERRGEPQTIVAALRGAAVTPQMPGARWLIVGILWALATAAVVPFMFAAVGNAVDLEIDLWGPERTAVADQD